MSRREYQVTQKCAEPGCTKTSFTVHTTQRDRADAIRRNREHPYRCTRHSNPDEVLRPDNTAVQHVLIASRVKASRLATWPGEEPGYLPGLFWWPEGAERASSGFLFGPGFKAHASDFPEGTRLVVTAYIETPEQAAVAAEIDAAGGA